MWNPALTGRAFLFVSFSAAIGAAWLAPGTDAISAATVLSKLKEGAAGNAGAYLESFLGNTAGCIGETNELLILISFAFLALTQVIDWRAPVTMVATVALLTFVSGGDVVMALTSGGLLFGASCGLLTFLIRKFGGYPEGVMFSILFMNSLSNFLNKLTSRKYGYGKAAKKGAAK